MKKNFIKYFVTCCLLLFFNKLSYCQNSILVNLGSSICSTPFNPSFSLIKNPLSSNAGLLADCNLSAQLPNYSDVYIAYNPTNNKLYISDVRSGTHSHIWLLDVGLPDSVHCPSFIPDTSTYSYPYILNNFEFDKNGNLWAFSNYDSSSGTCILSNFDITTGNTIASKTVQFPKGFFPTDINNGDLSILPNGRLFTTLGANPSILYEITNYMGGSGNAAANYLQTMPKNCFGLAFLNGALEVSGTNAVDSCYYFKYDIASNTLGNLLPFQNGLSPIDNTSINPIIGTTKQLVNSSIVNANTANLTYNIYVKNMGNVIINNINITDDLGATFGAGNVSNVTTNFINNAAGLTLNSAYNGTTNTNILKNGSRLPNQILSDSTYFFIVQVHCTATNLTSGVIYYNSAIGNGNIGSDSSYAIISDSSNNGPPSVVDPNNNNNAGDLGENIPTPFMFDFALPVHFISVSAMFINNTTSLIKWNIATPTVNADKFEAEYSFDSKHWAVVASVNITSNTQSYYTLEQQNIPSENIYYRIKEIDNNGTYNYSNIVLLKNNTTQKGFIILPNPANSYLKIIAPDGTSGNSEIELLDAIGSVLLITPINAVTTQINTTYYPVGTYFLRIKYGGNVVTQKILIIH